LSGGYVLPVIKENSNCEKSKVGGARYQVRKTNCEKSKVEGARY
jgi:hypothetical protein